MNDQRVTYAEVKLAKTSKRQQIKPKDSESSIAVTEQGLTYAELNLHTASRDLQENGKSYHCKGLKSPPEKLIAVLLGVTCLVLISIIVAVITFPFNPELKQNSNTSLTNTHKAFNCGPCPKEWFTYSNSCYYFSDKKKTWKESVITCQNMKSQLLYIENQEEMAFFKHIKALSWTGIYRNGSDPQWKLITGSSIPFRIREPHSGRYNCVMIQSDHYADNCEQPSMFYCKQKLDK